MNRIIMNPNVRLSPMTDDDFKTYLEHDIVRYAQENVKAGYWSEAEALDRSRQAHQRLLPEGQATKDHYFFRIEDIETKDRIGALWLSVDHTSARAVGFIYDLFVDEPFRRKGYAHQAMLALEDTAKELGLETLALHVFAHNRAARALYEQLGYELKSLNMTKELR